MTPSQDMLPENTKQQRQQSTPPEPRANRERVEERVRESPGWWPRCQPRSTRSIHVALPANKYQLKGHLSQVKTHWPMCKNDGIQAEELHQPKAINNSSYRITSRLWWPTVLRARCETLLNHRTQWGSESFQLSREPHLQAGELSWSSSPVYPEAQWENSLKTERQHLGSFDRKLRPSDCNQCRPKMQMWAVRKAGEENNPIDYWCWSKYPLPVFN